MRILFRDSKGRFISHKTRRKVYYFIPGTKERKTTIGLSKLKVKSIQKTAFESVINKLFPVAEMMKTASKSTQIKLMNLDRQKVKVGYNGKVIIEFYDDSGKMTGQYIQKGISKKTYKLIKPKGLKPQRYKEYKLTKKDGITLWAAIKSKNIYLTNMKVVEVTVKYRGEYFTFVVEFDDIQKAYDKEGKKYSFFSKKTKRFWSKRYYLSWRIREFIFIKGFRFSGKSVFKRKQYKSKKPLTKEQKEFNTRFVTKLTYLPSVTIGIRKLQ